MKISHTKMFFFRIGGMQCALEYQTVDQIGLCLHHQGTFVFFRIFLTRGVFFDEEAERDGPECRR